MHSDSPLLSQRDSMHCDCGGMVGGSKPISVKKLYCWDIQNASLKKFKMECVYLEKFKICLNFRFNISFKVLIHPLHYQTKFVFSFLFTWNFWPSWTDFRCVLRCPFWVALYSHCGQLNFCPSWIDFMCCRRLLFRVDLCSQCGQWNFWPSWTDFTWCFSKPIIEQLLMMILYESTYTW